MGMKTFLDVLTLCAYKQTSDRFTEPKRVRSTVKTLNNTETSNYYIMFLSSFSYIYVKKVVNTI